MMCLGRLFGLFNVPVVWTVSGSDPKKFSAIRFYQRRGTRLVALHRGAIDESRKLKPEMPDVGIDGIPLRDEIELEWLLS